MNSYKILDVLPVVQDRNQVLLIFDSVLLKSPQFKKWIQKFPVGYAVKSGEGLKDIQALPVHLKNILDLQQKAKTTFSRVYVFGGGSVGDFGGFIASILKRGLPVVHVPSTWLAALDSAHGGKTALNVKGYKNQVGTFHYPADVLIVRKVLQSQPAIRLTEAAGEFLKTALLGGPQLFDQLSRWDWDQGKVNWSDLRNFIEVKYKVIKKDPYEKKGLRHVLNLGHTMGHVWEAAYQLPHGIAVYYGLLFDMAWSTKKGYLSAKAAQKIMAQSPWEGLFDLKLDQKLFSLSEKKLSQYLLQDKKNSSRGLHYLFVKKPGQVFAQNIQLKDLVQEFQRQKKILEKFHEEF